MFSAELNIHAYIKDSVFGAESPGVHRVGVLREAAAHDADRERAPRPRALPQLHELRLADTKVTKAGAAAVKAALPECRVVHP